MLLLLLCNNAYYFAIKKGLKKKTKWAGARNARYERREALFGHKYFCFSSFAAAFVLVFSEIGAQIGYQKDYRLLGLPLAANRHIHSLAVLE